MPNVTSLHGLRWTNSAALTPGSYHAEHMLHNVAASGGLPPSELAAGSTASSLTRSASPTLREVQRVSRVALSPLFHLGVSRSHHPP